MYYDVTIITVRPGTHPKALARLKDALPSSPSSQGNELLACWYSELGALNQVLLLHTADEARMGVREKSLRTDNPFGIGEFVACMTMDTYLSFDFMEPMKPGQYGPVFEVRTYLLKPDGLPATIELWRKTAPGRAKLSPLLAAMHSVTGAVTRFMHIWPYPNLDERARLRTKAIADGVWPPPGGPDHLATQQADIFLPAAFSPIR